ncbi:MAG TPA: hypothetical protein VNJ04_16875 [Gemmatimonadaceae bacterium]|nr:hypothetical protein [Gemmatimonadaceae bacterium]
MIRNVRIARAWYGDCSIEGHWAALIRDDRDPHIETSWGRVELPLGQNVLFLRLLVRDGRMYLAGQGHQDGAAWLWNSASDSWREVIEQTNGQKVVAFGPDGLYVCRDGQLIDVFDLTTTALLYTLNWPTGSGGIQYVQDDVVVTGDETYGPGPSRLAEWTALDDLTIGQSYVSGAVIVLGSDRREIEAGDCRFIHAYRRGSSLACSMVTPGGFVAHWFDVDDLPTFPPEATAAPVPQPPIPPIPVPIPPVPTPEPNMPSTQLPAAVLEIRARYVQMFPVPQTPGGGDAHEERCRQWSITFAEQVAYELPGKGWGMKRGDANRPISKDTIARLSDGRLLAWDLLLGTGTGAPVLVPSPDAMDVTGQVFVPVTPTNHLGATPAPQPTPPTPTPPQPAPGRCNCQGELAVIAAQLSTLRRDLQETANLASLAKMEALEARAIAERVQTKPWPRLKLVVDAMADPISTNKTGWPGHAHQIRVRPVPE